MSSILISGLINLETTLRVERFPVDYFPVRYPFGGVSSTVSGVGYNIAKALTRLGNGVDLLSLIGRDQVGAMVYDALAEDGISGESVLARLERTPQSVVLYDAEGRRQINVDLKDIQEQRFPEQHARTSIEGCELAVLCNVNFSRPLIEMAHEAAVQVATDVHAIADLEDPYDRDFMAGADILFMSHERLPCRAEEWVRQVHARYGTEILVVGLGAEGALLHVPRQGILEHFAARPVRPIVSTVGAGDALFAAFVDGISRQLDPRAALRRAVLYAGYKIGSSGAAQGLLDADALADLESQLVAEAL
jgi:ribokinase